MSRTITITSGKGGVGKTNISINLAVHLSKMGYRSCLFDADLGLANINILLGLQPEYDLNDVIFHGRKLKDILIRTEENIDILPGSSGVEEMANLETRQMRDLIDSLSEIEEYDFLLFDTSAGISKSVLSFCLASSEVLLVITPEPTSLIDAFALLKVMLLNGFKGESRLVLNQCKDLEVAKLVYKKFKSAVTKHLGIEISTMGIIYQDNKVAEAVQQQRPVLSLYPNTAASKCIKKLAEQIVSASAEHLEEPDMEGFWRRCIQLIKGPLDIPGKKKEADKKESTTPALQGDQEEDPKTTEPLQEEGPKATEPLQEEGLKVTEPLQEESLSVKGTDSTPMPGPVSEEGDTKRTPSSPKEGEAVPYGRRGEPIPLEGAIGLDKSFMDCIERLIAGVSDISKELRLVREALNKDGMGPTQAETSGSPDTAPLTPGPISLDLKAFLRRRGPSKKEP